MNKYISLILIIFLIFVVYSVCYSQVEWEQKLDGWVDGQYQPYLFLGGSYYTKVSFADIDADGDYDMFVSGGGTGSFRLFENYGDCYEHRFRLKDIVHLGLVLRFKGSSTDADFADLDNDGDLDAILLLGNPPFGSPASNRYVNIGDSINPVWERPPYEEQILIYTCGPVSILDFDEDGDYDIISGLHDSTIHYCEQRDDPIPLYFHLIEEHLGNINIGSRYYIDVKDMDYDNDYDIVACVTDGVNKYYENVGGAGLDSLEWVLADSNFLGGQYEPDWLECPELVDIDADGDLDLFLAGAFAHLNYFENVGDAFTPQFEHRYDTTYFYNFPKATNRAVFVDIDSDGDQDIAFNSMLLRNEGPAYDPRWTSEPNFFPSYSTYKRSFCDIDGDDDQDILIPCDYGVILITNIGTPQEPAWDSGDYFLQDDPFTNSIFSVQAVDIDADNDYDLMLGGHYSGDLIFYKNIGDSVNPAFEHVTSFYLHLDTEMFFDPTFDDIDLDGDYDILISYMVNENARSKLLFYENIGTPQEAVWDSVTDDYMGWFSSGLVNHAYVDLGDYDADGDADLLMSYSLGLRLFLNQTIQTNIFDNNGDGDVSVDTNSINVSIYPNPFNESVAFAISSCSSTHLDISIYNILGQVVDKSFILIPPDNKNTYIWDGRKHPSGIYFFRIEAESSFAQGKLVLLK